MKNQIKYFKQKHLYGKNGIASNKKEGDGKTPEGVFELGIAFGTHSPKEIKSNIKYIQINKNLYWVDDVNSKYYNRLVDITKVDKDWNSAEHLMEYPEQYEYAIEIKANAPNIPGKRERNFHTL